MTKSVSYDRGLPESVIDEINLSISGFRYEYDEDRKHIAEGIVNACLGGLGTVVEYPPNETGIDWVVGDIHGLFGVLEKALERIGFDPGTDRLFCTGDLIDRGPDSVKALDWLERTWFHSVRGNHDQMLLDSIVGDPEFRAHNHEVWHMNGGDWHHEYREKGDGRDMIGQLADLMARMPLAIEISHKDGGRTGLVHADVPYGMDWSAVKASLVAGDRATAMSALWSRCRLNGIDRWRPEGADIPPDHMDRLLEIPGIGLVVSGHTPMEKPLERANRLWIDTGAALGMTKVPAFTLVRLGQEPVKRITLGVTRLEYEGRHEERDEFGLTPLHRAAREWSSSEIEELLAMGADPNARTMRGSTAAHIVILAGGPSKLDLLVKHGADIDARDNEGRTPLMSGCRKDSEYVVRYILKLGADTKLSDKKGFTALHHVAERGEISMIPALMDAGANIDARDEAGRTPLRIACERNRYDIVRRLLRYGADPDIPDNEGRVPSELASSLKHRRIEYLFKMDRKELEEEDDK